MRHENFRVKKVLSTRKYSNYKIPDRVLVKIGDDVVSKKVYVKYTDFPGDWDSMHAPQQEVLYFKHKGEEYEF